MRRAAAVAAAMLVGVTALSGAVAQTGSATTDSTVHTKRLVLHQTATHGVGRYSFVGTDTARSAATQKVVGYDTISGHYYPRTDSVKIQVAIALRGGIIVARVHSLKSVPNQYVGPIVKGSGKYNGIRGTVTAHSPSQNSLKTFVTLTYRF